VKSYNKVFIISTILVLVGIIIIFGVPTKYEGPLLLYINEQHSTRLMDAIGLALLIPGWLYLNLFFFRQWIKKKK